MPAFKTSEDYYNKLHLTFNALIAVTLLPFVWLFLSIQKHGTDGALLSGLPAAALTSALILIYAGCIYIAIRNKKQKLRTLSKKDPLRQRLNLYRSLILEKYVLLSAASVLCVIGLFLTKTFVFTLAYILSLVLLSIDRPVFRQIPDQIPTTPEEKDLFLNKLPIP